MPDAEPFTALGAGNGFPSCSFNQIDVSNYEKWVTLGGTQKGSSPTASEIELSRRNAMKLFWNTYSASATNVTEGTVNITLDTYNQVRGPDKSGTYESFEPKYRSCLEQYGNPSNFFIAQDRSFGDLNLNLGVYKMYNEGNFVGFGAFNLMSFREPSEYPRVQLILSSVSGGYESKYDTINGLPVVAQLSGDIGGPGSSSDFDAKSATITISDEDGSQTTTITFSGFTFYTYPA